MPRLEAWSSIATSAFSLDIILRAGTVNALFPSVRYTFLSGSLSFSCASLKTYFWQAAALLNGSPTRSAIQMSKYNTMYSLFSWLESVCGAEISKQNTMLVNRHIHY